MNVDFEAALQYIDRGNYEKALTLLDKAIMKEEDEGNYSTATEYRCVLGELYANLGMEMQARDELTSVIEYCNEHHVLDKQCNIAKAYINAFDGIPLPPEMLARNGASKKKAEHPGNMPIVPKPMQNKLFIAKQMNKKRR